MILQTKIVICLIFSFILSGITLSRASDIDAPGSDTITFPYERKTLTEGEKSVSFRLHNATAHTPYLIQTSIEHLNEASGVNTLEKNDNIPFMVTPPLHKLEPGMTYHWRVLFTGDFNNIAKDRETVYIAKFRAIPPVEEESDKSTEKLQFTAIQALHFKVYLRPKIFEKLTISDEQNKITFRLDGNEVVVKNNSPVYMSFERLNVGDTEVNADELFKPLPPLSEQRFTLSGPVKSKKVVWSILDEMVLPLSEMTSDLQN